MSGWCPDRTIESLCAVAGGPGSPKSFFLSSSFFFLSFFLAEGARASAREICLGATWGGGPGLGSEWAQGGLGGLVVGSEWACGGLLVGLVGLVGLWWAFGGLGVGLVGFW